MLGESIRRRRGMGRKRRSQGEAEREPRRSGERLRWEIWVPSGLAAIALSFGIGYFIAVRILFAPGGSMVDGTRVPELVGLSASEAEQRLAEVGLIVDSVLEMAHPRRPPGVVIAQTPLGGQQAPEGSGVGIAVSMGPARALVPDVRGFTFERAAELLRRRGFQVASRERLSDAPPGLVVGVEPEPGAEQQLPAFVTLLVSMGPPDPPPMLDEELRLDEQPVVP